MRIATKTNQQLDKKGDLLYKSENNQKKCAQLISVTILVVFGSEVVCFFSRVMSNLFITLTVSCKIYVTFTFFYCFIFSS